ncbi:hypothetical protein [Pseudomonas sp. 273]|uniref:hypothetical protein n=1 Tax=Pseudomonas sp. 273 TaxID=75692 RepID=UPI0023D7F8D4|nr:hypothetical protein [Pseudomonas sp. 273]
MQVEGAVQAHLADAREAAELPLPAAQAGERTRTDQAARAQAEQAGTGMLDLPLAIEQGGAAVQFEGLAGNADVPALVVQLAGAADVAAVAAERAQAPALAVVQRPAVQLEGGGRFDQAALVVQRTAAGEHDTAATELATAVVQRVAGDAEVAFAEQLATPVDEVANHQFELAEQAGDDAGLAIGLAVVQGRARDGDAVALHGAGLVLQAARP